MTRRAPLVAGALLLTGVLVAADLGKVSGPGSFLVWLAVSSAAGAGLFVLNQRL